MYLTFCLKLEIANQYGNIACRKNCHALSCIQQIPMSFISLRDACKIERGVTVRETLEQLTLCFALYKPAEPVIDISIRILNATLTHFGRYISKSSKEE